MAEDEIVQKVILDGAEEVQQEFKKTGKAGEDAFNQMGKAAEATNFDRLSAQMGQIGKAIQELTSHTRTIADSLSGASSAAQQFAQNTEEAAKAVGNAADDTDKFNDSLSKTQNVAGIAESGIRKIIAAATALGAAYLTVNSAVERFTAGISSLNKLGEQASAAGMDPNKFRELQFVFMGMGLSADEAAAKIKELGKEGDEAGGKLGGAAGSVQKLHDKLQESGVIFTQTAGGMNALREQVANMASGMARGGIDATKLAHLIEKFRDSTKPEELQRFNAELGKLITESGGAAAQVTKLSGPSGFGKVITIAPKASAAVTDLVKAWVKFKGEMTTENFQKVAETLAKITDEEKRVAEATKVMGESMAKTFNEFIKQGSSIEDLRQRYKDLGLTVDDTAVSIAKKLQNAMNEFNFAVARGKEEFAQLFAPSITPLITQFTNLIRQNRAAIVEWVQTIAQGAIKILKEFFAVIKEGDKAEIDNKWILKAVEAFKELGKTVETIWNGIIKPAVAGIDAALGTVTDAINQAFGTKLTKTDVGVAAIISFLIGGVNTLITAFASLATQSGPVFETIERFFASMGVSLRKLIADIKTFLTGAWQQLMDAVKGRDASDPNTAFTWADELVAFLKSTPGLIIELVAAFLLLRKAAAVLAPALSKVVGKEISGDAILAGAAILQMSGALDAAAKIATIIVGTFATLAFSLTILEKILKGLIFALGGARAAAFGFAGVALLIVTNWEKVKELLKSVGIDIDAIVKAIDDAFEVDFGVRPLQALGKLWDTTFGGMSQAWEKFKTSVLSGEGIIKPLIDLIIGQDLPRLAEALKSFVDMVKEKGFWKAITDIFEPGGLLDQAVVKFLNDMSIKFLGIDWNKGFQGLVDIFGPGGTLDQAVVKFINDMSIKFLGIDWNKVWEGLSKAFDIAIEFMNNKIDAFIARVKNAIQFFKSLVGLGADEKAPEKKDKPESNQLSKDAGIEDLKNQIDQLNPKIDEMNLKLQNLSPPNPVVEDGLGRIKEKLDDINNEPIAPPAIDDTGGRISELDEQLHNIGPKVTALNQQFASLSVPGTLTDAVTNIGTATDESTTKVAQLDVQIKQLGADTAGQLGGIAERMKASGQDISTLFVTVANQIVRVIPEAVDKATGQIDAKFQAMGGRLQSLRPLSSFIEQIKEADDGVTKLTFKIQNDRGLRPNPITFREVTASIDEAKLRADGFGDALDRVRERGKNLINPEQFKQAFGPMKDFEKNWLSSEEAVKNLITKLDGMNVGIERAAAGVKQIDFNKLSESIRTANVEQGKLITENSILDEKVKGTNATFREVTESMKTINVEAGKIVGPISEVDEKLKATKATASETAEAMKTIVVEGGKIKTSVDDVENTWTEVKSEVDAATEEVKEFQREVQRAKALGGLSPSAVKPDIVRGLTDKPEQASQKLDQIANKIKATSQSATDETAKIIKTGFEGIGTAITDAQTKVDKAFAAMKTATNDAKTNFDGLKESVNSFKDTLVEVSTKVGEGAEKFKELGAAAEPVKTALDASAVTAFNTELSTLLPVIDQLAAKFKEMTQATLEALSGFENTGTSIANAQSEIDTAFTAMKAAADEVKEKFDGLKEGVSAFKDAAIEMSASVGESVSKFTELAAAAEPVKASLDATAISTFNAALSSLLPITDQIVSNFQQMEQAANDVLSGFENVGSAITDAQTKVENSFIAMKASTDGVRTNFDGLKESVNAFEGALIEVSVRTGESTDKLTQLSTAAEPLKAAFDATAVSTFNSTLNNSLPVIDQLIDKFQQMAQATRDALFGFENIGTSIADAQTKVETAFTGMKTVTDSVKSNFDTITGSISAFKDALAEVNAKAGEGAEKFAQLAAAAGPINAAFDGAAITSFNSALSSLLPIADQLSVKFQQLAQATRDALSGFENIDTITNAQAKAEAAFAAMQNVTESVRQNFDSLKESLDIFKDALAEVSARTGEGAEKFTQLAAAAESIKTAFDTSAVAAFNSALTTLTPIMDDLVVKFQAMARASALLGFEDIGSAISAAQVKVETAFAAMKVATESVNFDSLRENADAFKTAIVDVSAKTGESSDRFTQLAVAMEPAKAAFDAVPVAAFNSALTTLTPVVDQLITKLKEMARSNALLGFGDIGSAISDAQSKIETAFAALKIAIDSVNFDNLRVSVDAFKGALIEVSAKTNESADKFTQLAAAAGPVKAAFDSTSVTTFGTALNGLLPVVDKLALNFQVMALTAREALSGFEGIGAAVTDTQAKFETAFAGIKTAIDSVNFNGIRESVASFNVVLGEMSANIVDGTDKFAKFAAAAKPIGAALDANVITVFNSALTTLTPVLDQVILKLQQMTTDAREVLTQFTNIGVTVTDTKVKFVPAFAAMQTAVDDLKTSIDDLRTSVAAYSAAIADVSAKLTEVIAKFVQLAGTAEPTKTAFDAVVVTNYGIVLNTLIPIVDQLILKFQEMGQAAAAALSAAQSAAPTTPAVPGQEPTPIGTPLPTQTPTAGGAPIPGAAGGPAQLIAQAQAAAEQVRALLQTTTEEITTFVQTAVASMGELFTGLGTQITTAVETVNTTIGQVREVFASAMSGIVDAITSGIASIQTGLQNLAAAIQAGLSVEPLNAFAAAMSQMASSVIANLDAMIQKFNEMAAAAQAAAAAAASASGGGGGGGGGSEEFATGGFIRGKGGIDNNLIWASAGEFMVKARAVRKYGLGLLHAINDGRFKIPRFNVGGVIGGLGSSLAVGGPVLSSMPKIGSNSSEFIDLGLPGGVTIPVTVTADVGRSIRNLAQRNRMNSIAKRQR